ncbi:MAG: DUF805 domain-containing protein [Pseudomonadota bacterium]
MANPPPVPSPASGTPVPPATDVQTFVWLFFRFDGRIGRQVYWLAILFLTAVTGLSQPFIIDPETDAIVMNFGPFQSFVYTMATICMMMVSIKRLHDLGLTGFFAVALLIPAVAVIATIWLGVRKGDEGPNSYGDVTDVRPGSKRPPTQPPTASNDA